MSEKTKDPLKLKVEMYASAGLNYEERSTANNYLLGSLANYVSFEIWAEQVEHAIKWIYEDRERRAAKAEGK